MKAFKTEKRPVIASGEPIQPFNEPWKRKCCRNREVSELREKKKSDLLHEEPCSQVFVRFLRIVLKRKRADSMSGDQRRA